MGRTGSVTVKQGNLVKANDVPILVTINQIEPIYVSFSIPEQQLAELKRFTSAEKRLPWMLFRRAAASISPASLPSLTTR